MKVCIAIFVMAVTTYLIRVLPLVLFKKPIHNRFVRSFLHYVPVACLTAMTFPALLYATEHWFAGAAGGAVAVFLALKKRSLMTVSGACGAVVLLVELYLKYL